MTEGPLDPQPVHVCSGCGCLVGDTAVHVTVCRPATGDPQPDPFGARVVEWLASLDPGKLEADALEACGFDTNGTVAVLEQLKREAANL